MIIYVCFFLTRESASSWQRVTSCASQHCLARSRFDNLSRSCDALVFQGVSEDAVFLQFAANAC